MSLKSYSSSNSEQWNGHRSFKDSPSSKLNDFPSPITKLSPVSVTSSTITPYTPSSSSPHQSWENALNDIVGVLRIQYRNDCNVMSYLTDGEKVKQLQYSTAAKMEWNRRVIKQERDSGMNCPTRSRRVAKDVAIDYIRRYLDGEEERTETFNKIQTLERQKDDNLTLIIDLERDLKRSKDEREKQIEENAKLVENMLKLRKEMDSLATVNEILRESCNLMKDENNNLRDENSTFRDENKKLRIENQDIRNENGALRSENQKVRHDNDKLRKEAVDIRNESSKIRGENQELRDENVCVRCESSKYRENNEIFREGNEKFRIKTEDLQKENNKIIKENLELRSKDEELKRLLHAQLTLLANPPKIKERTERRENAL